MSTETIWYLAGPMSGIPKFNFPTFEAVAHTLRRKGMTIVSPVELDDPETYEQAIHSVDGCPGNLPCGRSWGDFLSRDVKVVADKVDGIILLPDWCNSRGACLEATVAILCGHKLAIYSILDEDIMETTTNTVYNLMFKKLVGE